MFQGELENEVVELQQCNGDLSALRAESDATAGAFFPVLSLGNKLATGDKGIDKQRDLQDMESVLKELTVYIYFFFSFWFCVFVGSAWSFGLITCLNFVALSFKQATRAKRSS